MRNAAESDVMSVIFNMTFDPQRHSDYTQFSLMLFSFVLKNYIRF